MEGVCEREEDVEDIVVRLFEVAAFGILLLLMMGELLVIFVEVEVLDFKTILPLLLSSLKSLSTLKLEESSESLSLDSLDGEESCMED